MTAPARSTGAQRSARWRERGRKQHRVYALELHERLVACTLEAIGCDVGPPNAEEYQHRCEQALTAWVKDMALSVTRCSNDAELRVQVAEIGAALKPRPN